LICPSLYIEPVRLKEHGVFFVHTDNQLIFLVLQVIYKLDLDTLKWGEVAWVLTVAIYSKQLKIFVSTTVFDVDNPMVIGPKKAPNITFGFVSDADSVAPVDRTDEDILPALIGTGKGQVVPAWRKLKAGLFRISKEVLHGVFIVTLFSANEALQVISRAWEGRVARQIVFLFEV
jgi:hypothetical protein